MRKYKYLEHGESLHITTNKSAFFNFSPRMDAARFLLILLDSPAVIAGSAKSSSSSEEAMKRRSVA